MHRVLADERIAPYEALLGRSIVKRAAEELFGRARASRTVSDATIVHELASRLETMRRETLLRVINGTGIIINTNLGRAPIAVEALKAVTSAEKAIPISSTT